MSRNGKIRQTSVALICSGAAVFFGYHAIKGRHGLEARLVLDAKAQALQERLASLETMLTRLRRDSELLQDAHLDADSLDEAARSVLGYAAEGEIVVLTR